MMPHAIICRPPGDGLGNFLLPTERGQAGEHTAPTVAEHRKGAPVSGGRPELTRVLQVPISSKAS